MASSGSEINVVIRGRETVVPETPTERRTFFLSCLDIFWKDVHYNQRLVFYEAVPDEQEALANRLKRSLAQCLVHYYPWCGRLVKEGRPAIDCNDAGVEFVEACVDSPLLQLADEGFQMRPLFRQLCQHVDHTKDNSPLLSVQVTFFSDGGVAVGITQSHVIADGQALWNFMMSWSECSRGVPLSCPPVHDRELLALPNPSAEKASTWRFYESKVEGEEGSPSTGDSADETQLGPSTPPDLTQCLLIMPSSAIKQLKAEDGGVHTSYEVMCAHLWKHITIARQRPPHEPTFLFVLANCRSRINPPLPATYFGNAIGFDICVAKPKRICSETLHDTASRIHSTIVSIVHDGLQGFMNWLEIPENNLFAHIMARMPQGKSMNVASSPRFPAYEVDFGWGKPSAVRSPNVPGEGEIVLFGGNPKLGQDDVEMCIALPSDVLKRLLEDPKFLAKAPSTPFT
ncbi:hypothetical protein KP509_34G002100 [Ceratopteris richardii]|uniref:Uncharacterized protein n=1 Tax=Ceratopteris richardii TaxID=49495 RepID=A0A8T2QHH9_CERRI|nr:hypothetical protein KP509_34G002100 [Ceratopteris richardii]KAH7283339.1 hypothetical protein KP509_34G002100 [Ceratopteris richardii]